MSQRQMRKSLSEAEILSVFDALGLATQEQRDSILSRIHVFGFNQLSEHRVITWLSNSSEPVILRDKEHAKLEDTP